MTRELLDLNTKAVGAAPKWKQLERMFGGKWRYCGGFSGRWEQQGTKLAVQACAPPFDEYDRQRTHPQYFLTGLGTVRRVYWGIDRALTFDVPY